MQIVLSKNSLYSAEALKAMLRLQLSVTEASCVLALCFQIWVKANKSAYGSYMVAHF